MRYVLVLLLAGIAVVAYAQSSSQPQADVGRFTVVLQPNGVGAWKLDTVTGQLVFCTLRELVCTVAK